MLVAVVLAQAGKALEFPPARPAFEYGYAEGDAQRFVRNMDGLLFVNRPQLDKPITVSPAVVYPATHPSLRHEL